MYIWVFFGVFSVLWCIWRSAIKIIIKRTVFVDFFTNFSADDSRVCFPDISVFRWSVWRCGRFSAPLDLRALWILLWISLWIWLTVDGIKILFQICSLKAARWIQTHKFIRQIKYMDSVSEMSGPARCTTIILVYNFIRFWHTEERKNGESLLFQRFCNNQWRNAKYDIFSEIHEITI